MRIVLISDCSITVTCLSWSDKSPTVDAEGCPSEVCRDPVGACCRFGRAGQDSADVFSVALSFVALSALYGLGGRGGGDVIGSGKRAVEATAFLEERRRRERRLLILAAASR